MSKSLSHLIALVVLLSAAPGCKNQSESRTSTEFEIKSFEEIASATVSPDGKLLAFGDRMGEIHLWDLGKNKEIGILEGHSNAVITLVFSGDGKRLASEARDRRIIVWEVSSGKRLFSHTKDRWHIMSVALSSDGAMLASGDFGRIHLWDVQSGKKIREFRESAEGDMGRVYTLAFSRDGVKLASGGVDDRVRIWDVALGKELLQLEGHDKICKSTSLYSGCSVYSLAFSPDGRLLSSGSSDKTARLWSVDNGNPIAVSGMHAALVNAVAFSTDGKAIITAVLHEEGSAFLWSTTSGKQLGQFRRSHGRIFFAGFSSNNEVTIVSFKRQSLTVWKMRLDPQNNMFDGMVLAS